MLMKFNIFENGRIDGEERDIVGNERKREVELGLVMDWKEEFKKKGEDGVEIGKVKVLMEEMDEVEELVKRKFKVIVEDELEVMRREDVERWKDLGKKMRIWIVIEEKMKKNDEKRKNEIKKVRDVENRVEGVEWSKRNEFKRRGVEGDEM